MNKSKATAGILAAAFAGAAICYFFIGGSKPTTSEVLQGTTIAPNRNIEFASFRTTYNKEDYAVLELGRKNENETIMLDGKAKSISEFVISDDRTRGNISKTFTKTADDQIEYIENRNFGSSTVVKSMDTLNSDQRADVMRLENLYQTILNQLPDQYLVYEIKAIKCLKRSKEEIMTCNLTLK